MDNEKPLAPLSPGEPHSSSSSPDVSVRRLLEQLYLALTALTSVIRSSWKETLEAIKNQSSNLGRWHSETDRRVSVVSSQASEAERACRNVLDEIKAIKVLLATIRRDLMGDKSVLVSARSEMAALRGEITGAHILTPREEAIPARGWRSFVWRIASHGWPYAIKWLATFAVASLGASELFQKVADTLIEIAQRRS